MRFAFALVLLVLLACEPAPPSPAPTPTPPTPVTVAPGSTAPAPSPAAHAYRPKELIDHAADFVDKDLDVDIYEPMRDPDQSSIAPPGGFDVAVTDVGPKRFEVLAGLPKKAHPPIRVHGHLSRGRLGLELSVMSWAALPKPKPEKIAHAGDILSDPARWAGKVVEVEDIYVSGFEASYIGETGDGRPRIWLDYAPEVEVHCAPKQSGSDMYEYKPRRVHVVGTAYTKGPYGHLGGSEGLIVATTVDYLPCP